MNGEITYNIRDAEKDLKCTQMHFLSDKGGGCRALRLRICYLEIER